MFKKNTAVTGFVVHLISKTDGSDITTTAPVGYYTLDGGTQTAIAGTPVHENNGQWSVNLLAAEMNGDIVGLIFTHGSAITASFTIKTDTKIVSDLNDIAATAIVSSGAITTAAGKVSEVSTLTNHTAQTGDSYARLGVPAGASISADIANTPTVTEFNARTLLASGYFDSAVDTVTVGTNNDKLGYILSQTFPANFASLIITGSGAVDSMLQGYLDTVITETSLGRIAGNVKVFWDNADALTTKVVDDVGVAGSSLTQQQVRDAMKLAPTAGAPSAGSVDEHLDDIFTDTDDLQLNQGNWTTAAGFALATVCTEARLSELEAATIGKMANDTTLILADTNELQLNQGNWLTAVNFSIHTAADVWTAVTRELTSGNNIALAKGVGLTGLNDIAAATIVSGGAINTTGGAVDTITTYTGNTKQTGDNYALGNGASGFVAIKAETALIVADTDELQLDWVNTGRLDTILDSILSLLDDPRTEPGQGALAVNPDSMTKIDYIYKFLRNKVETTATEVKVYDDTGITVDHKKTISDDGTTFTDGEIVTGP